MELTIWQAIGLTVAFIIPWSIIMACIDISAEERKRRRGLEYARELQRRSADAK